MIELLFSTADLDLATGRTRVMAAINARAQAVGLGAFFPADQAFPGRAPDVPCSALSALLPAPLRQALAGDVVVLNVADGLLTRPEGDETVATGYRMELLVALRHNDQLIGNLAGVLSGPWAGKPDSTRQRTSDELALDPGAPPSLAFKEDAGVQLHLVPPRIRKAAFLGAP